MKNYDFSGYATRNDLLCSDGRTIRKDAFKHCDGMSVPLVWNHMHNDPNEVLGNVILENRNEGVYSYGFFNDSKAGLQAKELVKHGDIEALSIFANHLKQSGGDVLHGDIREVSLVLAGANPGAYIDYVSMAHSDGSESEDAIICVNDPIELWDSEMQAHFNLCHSDVDKKDKEQAMEKEEKKEEETKTEEQKDSKEPKKERSVQDVLDSLNEEQSEVVYSLIGQALAEDPNKDKKEPEKKDEDAGGKEMKHNVFDKEDTRSSNVLSHADQETVLAMAKQSSIGSFQEALAMFAEDNQMEQDEVLAHAQEQLNSVGGFAQPSEVAKLFPEYKDVRPGAPEMITDDQGWISLVMRKVHKSPISRIRTRQVDIRKVKEQLRAKGYKKGSKKKLSGNINLLQRTTDPQTVYVRNQLHRDDVIDITDFDYVQYLFNIDKMMLHEELATAIMLGDGREPGVEEKIDETHIRPIWTDDELYTLHFDLDLEKAKTELQGTNTGAQFGENYITAEAMINTVLYAREKYKGTGTPDLYCTPHMLNVMLLARDLNGRRIYSGVSELATALNVSSIVTAEQFIGKKRSDETSGNNKELVALICNLSDYSLGATKGGEITHFNQFDIDFNLLKSLLETRCSGALTRPFSAIAIEKDLGPTSPEAASVTDETL